jgi:hypothetical protein
MVMPLNISNCATVAAVLCLFLMCCCLQYYLGVAEELQRLGVLQPDSQLAGASAGSLIVACLKSGLPLATIQEACFQLADDCRCAGDKHSTNIQAKLQ